jgi:transaldolase
MPSKLEQLSDMTTIVADTGDIEAVRKFKPVDCTTNPTIVLKALGSEAFEDVVSEQIAWGRKQPMHPALAAAVVADRLAVSVGAALLELVPGRVSTEVDPHLSFNVAGSIAKARQIVASYKALGIERDRLLIKLASTWEGIRAAEELQSKDGINCNMTLLFNRAQAVASADANVFLISPFVGRILDWYKKSTGQEYTADTDPGVISVREIYNYYKARGTRTVVMGASFRNIGQIEALAGCDRLTISPPLLEELAKDEGKLERKLSPGAPKTATLVLPEDKLCHWIVGEDTVDPKSEPASAMDEVTFRWIMNQDQMATEKLSEGIRTFAKDLQTLRMTVQRKLLAV